jgi:hypothetical protein
VTGAPWVGVMVLALAGGGAACGRPASPEPGTPGTQAASGAGVDAGGAAAKAAAVPLVAHERLEAFVPTLDGWQRGAIAGAAIKLPAPASHVSVSYAKGTARIDLELTDTGGAPEFLEPLSTIAGTSFLQQTTNGYMKGTSVAGFPAVESWSPRDKIGQITILLKNRFMVYADGTGLDDLDPLHRLIARIDLARLAGLEASSGPPRARP